jgi:hypothetical protein
MSARPPEVESAWSICGMNSFSGLAFLNYVTRIRSAETFSEAHLGQSAHSIGGYASGLHVPAAAVTHVLLILHVTNWRKASQPKSPVKWGFTLQHFVSSKKGRAGNSSLYPRCTGGLQRHDPFATLRE